MLTRISSVVACVLSAVWLARAPDWEPLIALVTFLFCYAGLEVSAHRHAKKNLNDLEIVTQQRDESLDRESDLREEDARQREVIEGFHRREEKERLKVLAEVQETCRKIQNGEPL